jgi:hypothetical protein
VSTSWQTFLGDSGTGHRLASLALYPVPLAKCMPKRWLFGDVDDVTVIEFIGSAYAFAFVAVR